MIELEEIIGGIDKADIYLKTIIYKLSLLRINVELSDKLHLYDINIMSEDFFKDLFSIVYDSQYENLNHVQPNAKAVDLINEERKIVVQVTSNDKSQKVTETIKKFNEIEKYKEENYELQIFFLTHPKKIEKMDGVELFFIEDLLKEIKDNCTTSKKKQICRFLDENINLSLSATVTDKTDYNFIIRPSNVQRLLKSMSINFSEEDQKGDLACINKYIDKLSLVDYETRHCFYKIANLMYKFKDNNNVVEKGRPDRAPTILISTIQHSIKFNNNRDINSVLQDLENLKLIGFDSDWETGSKPIIYFEGMDAWISLVFDLFEFANKNNIDARDFFEKLNFSTLAE